MIEKYEKAIFPLEKDILQIVKFIQEIVYIDITQYKKISTSLNMEMDFAASQHEMVTQYYQIAHANDIKFHFRYCNQNSSKEYSVVLNKPTGNLLFILSIELKNEYFNCLTIRGNIPGYRDFKKVNIFNVEFA